MSSSHARFSPLLSAQTSQAQRLGLYDNRMADALTDLGIDVIAPR
jgi:hypothetical protein